MTISPNNFLDFGNILFNEIAGGPVIAYFLVLGIIIYLSIQFRVPGGAMLAFIAIWSLIATTYSSTNLIIVLILLFVGLGVYFAYSKILKRSWLIWV